jgi:hypothetical protein
LLFILYLNDAFNFIFIKILYIINFSYSYLNWKNDKINDAYSYDIALSMDKERLDNSNIYSLI